MKKDRKNIKAYGTVYSLQALEIDLDERVNSNVNVSMVIQVLFSLFSLSREIILEEINYSEYSGEACLTPPAPINCGICGINEYCDRNQIPPQCSCTKGIIIPIW